MSIGQIQEEINRELSLLNGDAEMITFYIISMGQKNPGMSPAEKTDEHIIRGCHSKVWLKAHAEGNRIYFSIDSNTLIAKGIGSLLIRLFNDQTPEDIMNTEINFIYKNGMARFIGSQRMLGFKAMINQMQVFARNLTA